jgi:hypothetical protein
MGRKLWERGVELKALPRNPRLRREPQLDANLVSPASPSALTAINHPTLSGS